MSYKTNISPGAPPLLWSNMEEAFKEINQNFSELQLYFSDSTITPIDLTNLYSSLSPGDSQEFSLGSIDKKWRSVFTSSYSSVPGNELNGVFIGPAHIRGVEFTVNLPDNSTIGGDPETGIGTNLIIDPDKTFFKTVRIDSVDDIVAPEFNAVLKIDSGTAIGLSADVGEQTLVISNTGVTELLSSTGISVSGPTGSVTITNTGVTALGPVTALPAGLVAGSGIAVSSATDSSVITNTGVISVTGGFGITVSADTASGTVQITNNAPAQAGFSVIRVDDNNDLVADSVTDVLVITAGYGVILSTAELLDQFGQLQDTLTITVDNNIDIVGSVFSDIGTLMVDAVNGIVVAPVVGNVTGNVNGNVVGDLTGNVVGNLTGNVVGDLNGSVFADNSTLLIDGTEGKIVGPLEGNSFTGALNFDGSTWTNVPGTVVVNTVTNDSPFVNSGSVEFSFAVGDIGAGFNINFSAPLTETSKVRIAELQSNSIIGDLLGSVFSDTSLMLINGTDGSLMYYPSETSDWNGTAPTTVGEALDRLAAAVTALNSGIGA